MGHLIFRPFFLTGPLRRSEYAQWWLHSRGYGGMLVRLAISQLVRIALRLPLRVFLPLVIACMSQNLEDYAGRGLADWRKLMFIECLVHLHLYPVS